MHNSCGLDVGGWGRRKILHAVRDLTYNCGELHHLHFDIDTCSPKTEDVTDKYR
jgi:hypothetical protein